MNIQEIEQKMIETCDRAIALGWVLTPGKTYYQEGDKKVCCALGASYAVNPTWRYLGYLFAAYQAYGMQDGAARAFTRGFDAEDNHIYGSEPHFQLGSRIRAHYNIQKDE